LLSQKGYPLTVAETPQELLRCQQWATRGFVKEMRHPSAGNVSVLGPLWRQPDIPGPLRPAPLLGEANGELLASAKEAAG
jgi:crotonobetainyl-CoA:carnitine CoA-transferase CaiB-like acyl-CoA transferase